ncbi:MAG: hypothetical protein L0219_13870 [Phycisphaerales bacterium]|nr:hypothetical protein [Phycisphaerales bacterium]
MGQQYSAKRFFREVSVPLLRRYFDGLELSGGLPWGDLENGEVDAFVDAFDELPVRKREQIEGDFMLVTEMGTEDCSVTIRDVAELWKKPWAAMLDSMQNDYERAFLAFLEDRELLEIVDDYGEIDRFADSRWWRRSVGKKLEITDDEKAIKKLSSAIRALYKKQGRGRLCDIDSRERSAPQRYCYFAYPEDLPKTDQGYDEHGRLGRRTRRTTMEIIFVYRPEDGILEMVARGDKQHKEALAAAFCTTILGLTTLPAPDQKPPFDLNVLKDRNFAFPTDTADNIDRVEVRQLRFDLPGNGNRRLVVSVRPRQQDDPKLIYSVVDDALNKAKYQLASLDVSQARLSIRFRGVGGRRAKTLTFDITFPDRCNLKDSGKDVVGKRYLKLWKIANA